MKPLPDALGTQARTLLKAALNGKVTDPVISANIREVVNGSLPDDQKNALLQMIFKGLEVNRNVQLFIADPDRPVNAANRPQKAILSALGDLPLATPDLIESFLNHFLETLPQHADAWTDWATGNNRGDIRFMVRGLHHGQDLEWGAIPIWASAPTDDELGAKLAKFADEGVITAEGLLRMCALISSLSQHGIDEGLILRALMQAWPHHVKGLQDAIRAFQADPMLAVKRPPTFTVDQDVLDGGAVVGGDEAQS